ncbi:unnamed protein product [Trifolium pratense]|uniref:Uncharacterized protein n=1 Tax=Trifolium pratense TaxID=57577 RepID=A0ACB0JJT6_TRIPR|nr:unnamed protein product [Trifolium pratense]
MYVIKTMKLARKNQEDRLSGLPVSVIVHILSFLNTKEALQTFILSKRWKDIPKYLPILRLSSLHFKSPHSLENLVSQLLSLCRYDHSSALHTVDFIESHDFVEPDILKGIVGHAVSRNVQTLRISITCDIQQFPSCFFSSQTLTSLDLSVHHSIQHRLKIVFPSSLNLPSLTRLFLRNFYFYSSDDDGCVEPFSVLNKLDTLIIEHCRVLTPQILCISSTTLVNLNMQGYQYNYKFQLSTPSLRNFAFGGSPNQKLCVSHPYSIKHLHIDVTDTRNNVRDDAAFLLSWLHELDNIESLTVSSNTLQVLSFAPDLFKVNFTSLCHLESLQVEMKPLTHELNSELSSELHNFIRNSYSKEDTFIPKRVVYFLIQNSLSATVNIIPYDD